MARLIDADKLKAHYSWWKGGTGTMTYDEAKETFDTIIDLQPIIEIDFEPFIGLRVDNKMLHIDNGYLAELYRKVHKGELVEPKHGRWIFDHYLFDDTENEVNVCSVCNHMELMHIKERYKFCPNCGAKMDEGRAYAFEVGETYSAAEGEL